MGMIDTWFLQITRPFRELRAKWMGIKNVQDGLAADVKRLKGYAGSAKKQAEDAKKQAKEAMDKANAAAAQGKAAAGQAQGVWGQAQGQMQAVGGQFGPGGGAKPGMAGQPGMPPGAPGMPPPGAPGMPYGAPPGAPGGYGAAFGGGPPMGGMPMGMGAPPGPPQPGQRTMAIVAGGTSGMGAVGWVVPLKGPHKGQLITLKPQSVIGKDPACEVVLNDPFLSGRHATIRAQNGMFVLEDHSTNGTWVNDKQIKRHELVDNDFIKVGQTLMKFKLL
jgi:FHA domain-containing protein